MPKLLKIVDVYKPSSNGERAGSIGLAKLVIWRSLFYIIVIVSAALAIVQRIATFFLIYPLPIYYDPVRDSEQYLVCSLVSIIKAIEMHLLIMLISERAKRASSVMFVFN